MTIRRAHWSAALTLLLMEPALAADETAKACAVAALTEYTKSALALLQRPGPVMSVETTVAKRRLEEQYCLRLVRCLTVGQQADSALGAAVFAAQFGKCLDDVERH